MKKGKFSDEQIVAVLRDAEATTAAAAARKHGLSEQSIYRWRAKYAGMEGPTANAECTAEQAYRWSGGRAVFASGSPFGPVDLGNKTLVPGQGNNAYIFPGVGLGAVVSATSRVTDEMFLAAARLLAWQVSDEDLALGRVYPPLTSIREVSALIAAEVASVAYREGLARHQAPAATDPASLLPGIRKQMFQPVYPHYA